MRDKERIHRILNKIELIWNFAPDTRFGQLMDILITRKGLFPHSDGPQGLTYTPYMWVQEDDKTEQILDEIIEHLDEHDYANRTYHKCTR